jgi:hypothetical protein
MKDHIEISVGAAWATGAAVAGTAVAGAAAGWVGGTCVGAGATGAVVAAAGTLVGAGAQPAIIPSTKPRMTRIERNFCLFIETFSFLKYIEFDELIFQLAIRAFHFRHDCPIGNMGSW